MKERQLVQPQLGVAYTHWGRSNCSGDASLVYHGTRNRFISNHHKKVQFKKSCHDHTLIFYSALGCIGVITTTFAVSFQLRLASLREETFRERGGEGVRWLIFQRAAGNRAYFQLEQHYKRY